MLTFTAAVADVDATSPTSAPDTDFASDAVDTATDVSITATAVP